MPQAGAAFFPLAWAENKHLRVVHMQRWGQNQSWAPGAVKLRKNNNLSMHLHKSWVKSEISLVNPVSVEYLNKPDPVLLCALLFFKEQWKELN